MFSERRNELIAELLHRVHFIEKWGSGIRLILSKEPSTRFEEVGTHFIVAFKRKGVVPEGEEKVPEKVPEKVLEKITTNQHKILDSVLGDRNITISALAIIVGISERKIRENIRKLKSKGLLKRIGPDKGGHWEIVKP